MAWYEQMYINRRDWVLSNIQHLNLTPLQVCIVLLIDLYNSHQKPIDHAFFEQNLSASKDDIDNAISGLSQKGLLKIEFSQGRLIFNIDNLFTYETISVPVSNNQGIVAIIQEQFGRLLTSTELKKLDEVRNHFSDDQIKEALREALFYKKCSIDYMYGILKNWEVKNNEE